MGVYSIYAGLGGQFGGVNFIQERSGLTYDEALNYAHEQASEAFNAVSGTKGIPSFDDLLKVAEKELDPDDYNPEDYKEAVNDYATELYENEKDNLIEYYVEEEEEEEEDDREEDDDDCWADDDDDDDEDLE